MDIHQIIHQKLVKLSQLNHVIEIIFWSGRNWRKRRRRVIFTFLLICNFKSIFLFCRLQSPDYFYLILLEYKNVPTEVNFISRKPDWKWAMLTKVTRWGFPFACWVEIACYFILYLSNAINSDLRQLNSIDISFLSRYGFLLRYL